MKNNFANNLKFLRLQKNITQEELGKRLGKDYSTIGKWENGTRSPIMEDVIKIAEYFNVSLTDLIANNYTMGIYYTPTDEDYKKILKEQGLMDDNNYINEENLNKLLKIAEMIDGMNKKEN